jgi:putative Holliday junction resolvase
VAVDIGEKRIGVAVSDPSQTIAQPLITLTRRAGKRFPMDSLRPHLERLCPVGIVVGLPLASDGTEDERAESARDAGDLLMVKVSVPVTFWDERMTTARALSAVRELGGRIRGRRGDVDQLAATVLLQSFLDRRRT